MLMRTRALLERLPKGAVRGAEVGVYRGQMSAELLHARGDLFLYMVDNWAAQVTQPAAYQATGDPHARLDAETQREHKRRALRVTKFAADRREVLHLSSVVAADTMEVDSLDFVFLDADHSYEGVTADIEAWLPTLKEGALLGGHDYDHQGRYDFGVNEAVDEVVRERGWTLETAKGSTWFVTV